MLCNIEYAKRNFPKVVDEDRQRKFGRDLCDLVRVGRYVNLLKRLSVSQWTMQLYKAATYKAHTAADNLVPIYYE